MTIKVDSSQGRLLPRSSRRPTRKTTCATSASSCRASRRRTARIRSTRVLPALARGCLPALHGLDAHQRVEDQPSGPIGPRRRTRPSTTKGVPLEVMIDLSQPAEGRSVVLHAAPGRRRLRPPASPRWSRSSSTRTGRSTSSTPTRSGTACSRRAATAGQQGKKLGFGPKERPWEAAWHVHGPALGRDLQDLGRGLRRPRAAGPRAALAGGQPLCLRADRRVPGCLQARRRPGHRPLRHLQRARRRART